MSTGHTLWDEIETPIGCVLLAQRAAALARVHFQGGPRPLRPPAAWRRDRGALRSAATELAEYFAGERRRFTLPLAPLGTPFQLAVWRALLEIPYGETTSYGAIARRLRLGPAAARAVGLANGANPLPIVIPCHRVIGADGSLTGFGGGLPIKHALLTLEGAPCVADLFSPAARERSAVLAR